MAELPPEVEWFANITNALSNEADITYVQSWLGHSAIATTRLYDRRQMQSENSPTFKVKY